MKEMAEFEIRYWKQLEGPETMGMSADQMAAVVATYPMLKTAMDRFQKEGSKLQGTPLETTSTFEAIKSKDQMAQQAQSSDSSKGGGIGGLLARKIAKKNDEPKARATVLTLHHEVLELSTTVAPSDIAVPADFKEKK